MAIVLSLLTAAIFGAGDFAGGLAAKRARAVEVVWGSHVVGLVGVAVASMLIADEFAWADLGVGAVAGAFGGIGVFFLYRRLAVGPMAVVAPITAVTSAVVPVVVDVLGGGAFTSAIWAGMLLGIVAIGLVSSSAHASVGRLTSEVITESLLAGLGFGAFFVFVDLADDATAPWPIFGARVATTVALGAWFAMGRTSFTVRAPATLLLIAVAGSLDTLSNVLFLYATTIGDLAIVSVLSSLYPASTVLLAWLVLDERMSRTQFGGLVLAVAATALIAVG